MFKKIVPLGLLAIAIAGPAWARTASADDAAALLNKANQMNYEEQETAKMAHSKAGDNQALITYADTIRGDHEANEEAVSALSRQKSIKLEGTNSDKVEKAPMKDLSGGAFNDAYLDEQIKGHKDALSMFESAKGNYKSDPDMELYIEQTLPVLQAHLKMAQNLRRHVSPMSAEDPSNNKSTTKSMGKSADQTSER
jgi:putative membrane protein